MMLTDKVDEDIANNLARRHADLDGDIKRAFRLVTPHVEPRIGLLFIAEDAYEIGFHPLSFGPSSYSHGRWVVMADISPDELAMIKSNSLPLPDGWVIGREINLDA
jgi:hypothetical protein